MLGILAWKFILWKLFMALPIFPLDFLHQPFPYILLSNFWISQFTCCFAPPHPALPHRFSSLPRPAPYRTSLGFFASHQPLILQNQNNQIRQNHKFNHFHHQILQNHQIPQNNWFPQNNRIHHDHQIKQNCQFNWMSSFTSFTIITNYVSVLCISNNCSTKRLKFLFGTENIFD